MINDCYRKICMTKISSIYFAIKISADHYNTIIIFIQIFISACYKNGEIELHFFFDRTGGIGDNR